MLCRKQGKRRWQRASGITPGCLSPVCRVLHGFPVSIWGYISFGTASPRSGTERKKQVIQRGLITRSDGEFPVLSEKNFPFQRNLRIIQEQFGISYITIITLWEIHRRFYHYLYRATGYSYSTYIMVSYFLKVPLLFHIFSRSTWNDSNDAVTLLLPVYRKIAIQNPWSERIIRGFHRYPNPETISADWGRYPWNIIEMKIE